MSRFTPASTFPRCRDALYLASGLLQIGAGKAYNLQSGTLQGYGTIGGDLTSSGIIAVGNGAGTTLTVTGNFSQNGGELKFWAASNIDWGVLEVTGNATVNSATVTVDVQPGYNPQPGFRKRVIWAGGNFNGAGNTSNWTLIPGVNFLDVELPEGEELEGHSLP